MQVNNFIKYLDNSELIASISADEITPVIKEFPYCQTGHLMYTIQLNGVNSILFDEQLKKAASYCSDRVKLFEYIHQETKEEVQEEKKEIGEEKIQEEKIESLTEKTLVDEKFIPSEGEDELAILQKEYLSQAISSSILLEAEANISFVEENPEVVEEKEIDLFDVATEHTFSDWLKHFNGEVVDLDRKEGGITPKKVINQDIIDKFIQEDPRIVPKKTTFYSPTNMARLSVTDSGIVSETLALIYVDQGNFDKAIRPTKNYV